METQTFSVKEAVRRDPWILVIFPDLYSRYVFPDLQVKIIFETGESDQQQAKYYITKETQNDPLVAMLEVVAFDPIPVQIEITAPDNRVIALPVTTRSNKEQELKKNKRGAHYLN